MSGNSKIEWTEKTWNPVTGCSKVSQGCKHCYAEREFPRIYPGRAFTDVRCHDDRLDAPLHWRKPSMVFVNSMSDLFHENVPNQFIVDVFGIMALAHWHTFQILTKRPKRALEVLAAGDHGIMQQFTAIQLGGGIGPAAMFRALDIKRRDGIGWQWPLPNVWLGVSVEDQKTADERIPLLLQTPAAVRWVSAEPLLGPVALPWLRIAWQCSGCRSYFAGSLQKVCPVCKREDYWTGSHTFNPSSRQTGSGLDWVVCGGESGPKARPMHPDWARSLRDQCQAASVPFFFKQWGEWMPARGKREFPKSEGISWLRDGRVCLRDFTVEEHRRRIRAKEAVDTRTVVIDQVALDDLHAAEDGDEWDRLGYEWMYRVGKKAAGRLLDGVEHSETRSVPHEA